LRIADLGLIQTKSEIPNPTSQIEWCSDHVVDIGIRPI